MMEENDKIWELMALVLSNEASLEQRFQLQQLLSAHPELEQQYQNLSKLWLTDTDANGGPVTRNNIQLQRILQKGEQQRAQLTNTDTVRNLPVKQGSRWFAYAKYAAAAILLLAGTWFIINKKTAVTGVTGAAQQVVTVKNGGTTKVVLADGTQVWLNAGSRLIYPATFTGNTRNVKLIGEGFFDVVKDKHHPFIVATGTFNLKVLGTAFNVRAYQNDNTSEAALVRGKIEVTLINQPDKKIVLKPSEKLTIKNSYSQNGSNEQGKGSENMALISLSTIHQSEHDTLPAEALWIEHKLVFDEEPFESIARKIERRYNVRVVFKNNAIKHENFTGKFYNESVYKVLQSLQTIESFHFNINNDLVTIY